MDKEKIFTASENRSSIVSNVGLNELLESIVTLAAPGCRDYDHDMIDLLSGSSSAVYLSAKGKGLNRFSDAIDKIRYSRNEYDLGTAKKLVLKILQSKSSDKNLSVLNMRELVELLSDFPETVEVLWSVAEQTLENDEVKMMLLAAK